MPTITSGLPSILEGHHKQHTTINDDVVASHIEKTDGNLLKNEQLKLDAGILYN